MSSVWTCGLIIAALVLIGDVRTTWSFSAFTVLIYYALTNLAAIRMPAEEAMFPHWIPVVGLAGCLSLAIWVDPRVLFVGVVLLALGAAVHLFAHDAR